MIQNSQIFESVKCPLPKEIHLGVHLEAFVE